LHFFVGATRFRRLPVRNHKSFASLLGLCLFLVAVTAWPSSAAAQRRGSGRGRVILVGGYYYRPFFYDPFYSPFYNPWYLGSWYQYPYPYPPYGRYAVRDELASSVRLEVTPRGAEVYVDGYRAGNVDDFDGFFQRLRLRPGEHEIVLYFDGYRTVRQRLYLSYGSDQRIRYTMVPLAAGEQAEPRPAAPPPQDEPANAPYPPPDRPRGGPPQGPPRMPPTPQPAPGQDARFGSVSIRVQPADADVLIDGERWSAPAMQDRLVVQLSDGRHHIDVQKDGYEKYSSDVQVRRGETVALNISLLRR
jgi:hypothetical protein